MWRIIFVATLVALATPEKASFRNYKVFQVTPTNDEQLEILKQLEYFANDYEFWQGPSAVSKPAHLMVAPASLAHFSELMNSSNIAYELSIADVQALIDQQNAYTVDSKEFNWSKYHTLEEIYEWLDSLPAKYPGKVEVVIGGSTYEGREIKGVKISFGPGKKGVFVDGGIHAREWISPATVTYLINQFLNSTEPEVRALAEANDWYMFPVINPDGYSYSHSTNRLWRKTRSKNFIFCKGVDANRNWDYKWNTGGASKIPCLPNYAGKKPFSEVETKTLSEYMKSIGSQLFAYISFHSFSQLLLFPYGHTSEHLENYDELSAIAKVATEALSKRYGTTYKYGNIPEILYVATGSSMDWAKAVLKLPISYTYELRSKTPIPGFLLPAKYIIPNGEEVLDSFVALFKEAAKYGYPKAQ